MKIYSLDFSLDIPCFFKTPGITKGKIYNIASFIFSGIVISYATILAVKVRWIPLATLCAIVCANQLFIESGLIRIRRINVIKKSERRDLIDYQSDQGKKYIREALEKLSQNGCSKVITSWELGGNQSLSKEQQSDAVHLFTEKLQGGTCFGESMTILEFLSTKISSSQREISIDEMRSCLKPEKFIYYQIIHSLSNFLLSQRSKYAFGLEIESTLKKLQGLLPNHGRMIGKSEKIPIKDNLINERLCDFPIQVNLPENCPFAIRITLLSNNSGHTFIIYYDNIEKNYYFYDSYSSKCGFFESHDRKRFFEHIVKHLKETYSEFKYISLEAYQLNCNDNLFS